MSVENNPSMKKVKHFIFEWLIPIALALIIALLIRHFVAFTFNVPTTSMYPTINAGDFGIATKVYNKNSLKRGDVVVFKSEELNMVLVKRLIGLPGDKVSIKDNGDVYVNGEKLQEDYVKNPGGIGGDYEVPANCFFFLGDNRKDSLDARYWATKYIPFGFVDGKAQFILFPFNRISKL
ncbi:MAG: signal peptidase I [Oscillospiraceae bacterium]|nr:signal peptidase I [Oscillospiraceae bacterium]